MSERVSGVVKWYDHDKGYGFVAPAGGGKDVFVHVSALRKSNPPLPALAEGEKVTFQVQIGDRGPKAENVQRAA